MQIISASMDVSKIDKSKLVRGKNGALYFNFDIVVGDSKNQYGQDVSLSVPQTKEQREAKEKKVFIGNCKTVWRSPVQTASVETIPSSNPSDELPF